MYTITFKNQNTGNHEISRYKQTLRGAKVWARWLSKQSFADDVRIYRGQEGGERVQ